MSGARLFALDQGFPVTIVSALADHIMEANLVPLSKISARLTSVDDWEILVALRNHPEPWDGLITTDPRMLRVPKVLVVLHQTRLTVVAAEAAGHDPLKATGLLLTHLPSICKQTSPRKAQFWELSARSRTPDRPMQRLNEVADRIGKSPRDLVSENELTPDELAKGPLVD